MKRYKELLNEALIRHGWEIVSRRIEEEWFAEEHWIVRSTRERRGFELVVTFLVDPQFEGQEKSAAITYVAVNQSRPTDRVTAGNALAELCVADVRYSDAVEQFLVTMDEHRSALNDLKNIPRAAARGRDDDN